MAKFTVEVELDWINEENVDEEIKKEVIAGLQNRITRNIESKIEEEMNERIKGEVEKIVDSFLKQVTTDKISEIQIPHKESSYSSKVEMIPISVFIGKRFESALTEKTLNERGGKYDRYDDRGGKYSILEYLTKGYIAEELNGKIIGMIQQAKNQAEESLVKNLEQNLQQQLNADMIKRLNIPQLLQNLQSTIEQEGIE
ncbi:hypothetical protein CSV75_01625 [Sporosarcina sp. P18a]|uniref:hypothetical protein n=1 Tax=Sporosarcina sp. P18a TaxID=2048259 RepID=UPI000C16A149|nr:hypothetical protein [Sporosarcina sp. P18a]PIC80518.1 hypothetical protein CSV75_01625 [Sporosarcina sp. P18a]